LVWVVLAACTPTKLLKATADYATLTQVTASELHDAPGILTQLCRDRLEIEYVTERLIPGAVAGSLQDFVDQPFAHDFQYDKDFPSITLIEPAFSDDPFATEPNDNHPPLPMGTGESFLLKIYNVFFGTQLARERFDRTAVVVYYDEHGGFFDHVPPLKLLTPSGQLKTNTKWTSFTTTGPRVPAIVISPRVDPGVYKGNLDHTSVLRFLGERFGPKKEFSPEVTARHATTSADLRSLGEVFDLDSPRTPPSPPLVGGLNTRSFPNGQPATTDAQRLFLEARQRFHADEPDGMAHAHPGGFFVKPHHG